jgi:hypothetical protein
MEDESAAVRRSAKLAKKWADQLAADIETAYRAGTGLNRLAKDTGRTVEGIRQLLKRRGVELRPPHVR